MMEIAKNMGLIKEKIYALYKKLQSSSFVATVSSYLYVRVFSRIQSKNSAPTFNKKTIPALPKIAFVCDDMTWQDFKDECNSIYLTPYNWRKVFQTFCPDIFFCESTWSGITEHSNCWRGQVYKNKNVRYDNRRELMQVLDYCKNNGIPTVFWNKEDPTFWGDETYNFVDTALHFDHILTTAQECIPDYKQLGHKSVNVLMFGFSPNIFFFDSSIKKAKKAVFAGSWYTDQPKRCAKMEAIFDMVLQHGIPLEIYNRQSDSSNPVHKFPEKYKQFLRPRVPFSELGDIFRNSVYAISINTVTTSETMFARRVFEAMACGCMLISNDSVGLKKLFPGRIWLLNEPFEHEKAEEIILKNQQDVYKNHTCKQRLSEVMEICEQPASFKRK